MLLAWIYLCGFVLPFSLCLCVFTCVVISAGLNTIDDRASSSHRDLNYSASILTVLIFSLCKDEQADFM